MPPNGLYQVWRVRFEGVRVPHRHPAENHRRSVPQAALSLTAKRRYELRLNSKRSLSSNRQLASASISAAIFNVAKLENVSDTA